MLPTGECIFSANEICRFLCSECGQEQFCGGTPEHQALIDFWLGWEASELKVLCILPLLIYTNFSIHANLPCSQRVSRSLFGLLQTLFLLTNHLFYSLHEAICRPIPLSTAQLNCRSGGRGSRIHTLCRSHCPLGFNTVLMTC